MAATIDLASDDALGSTLRTMNTGNNVKTHSLDGSVLRFDRATGANRLERSPRTRESARHAPRVLQVGLLTPCNLACSFCYRDLSAPSRLTAPFLFDLLRQADGWGVTEVAFGGGEPFLFHGFVELVRTLHASTRLGLNVTTNGTLLTPRILRDLGDSLGEIRLSAYEDNHYRRTLRMLAGREVGLNWLVTPRSLPQLEPVVRDALALGAGNVLLLGYKGSDATLRLDGDELARLASTIRRIAHLPIRLDICWYPHLTDLPHLFPRRDCGAGDEFLVITPDQAVQPCSFHHERIPFQSFADLQRIYTELRERRPAALIGGCTRELFAAQEPVAETDGIWIWNARASNNSGDATILGIFRTADEARQAAESLRELARAHDAFLGSVEGEQWIEEQEYDGSSAAPLLKEFGAAHAFDWPAEQGGLWWEEGGSGAPVLTAGSVGRSVVVYHEYCMGLPEEALRRYFESVGAVGFLSLSGVPVGVSAMARGRNERAEQAVRDHFERAALASDPHDVAEPPPWGETADDPRLALDENRSAALGGEDNWIECDGETVRIRAMFDNPFAGSIALEQWLRRQGYQDIDLAVNAGNAETIAAVGEPGKPRTGLFTDVRPRPERLKGTPKEIVAEAFQRTSLDQPLQDALRHLDAGELLELAFAAWTEQTRQGRDVDEMALQLIAFLGPRAAAWAREMWLRLAGPRPQRHWLLLNAVGAALPAAEAFELARGWYLSAADRKTRLERLRVFEFIPHPQALDLIEELWLDRQEGEEINHEPGVLCAQCGIDWPRIEDWIGRGRPLSLLALGALVHYANRRVPSRWTHPTREQLKTLLLTYREKDPVPRVGQWVRAILKEERKFVRPGPDV